MYRRVGGGALVGVLVLVAGKLNYDWYFQDYDIQYRLVSWNTTEMGAVVRGFAHSVGDLDHAYHVAYTNWADTRDIGINAVGSPTWENSILLDTPTGRAALERQRQDPANKLYIVNPNDEQGLQTLREAYPAGRVRPYHSATPGKDFFIFFVPAA